MVPEYTIDYYSFIERVDVWLHWELYDIQSAKYAVVQAAQHTSNCTVHKFQKQLISDDVHWCSAGVPAELRLSGGGLHNNLKILTDRLRSDDTVSG